MKLVCQLLLLLFNKVIRRKSNGYCLRIFSSNMGMAYIKLCQMLALQNIGNLFTEQDRLAILSICYDVNPIPYSVVRKQLKEEYGDNLRKYFSYINHRPIGSASVSQVHRGRLRTGEDVVLKVKRKDVMVGLDKDIANLHFMCNHFGWIFGITNNATSVAWDYYLRWIKEETDFRYEVKNIGTLQRFANNVQGKVYGTGKLIVPKVYEGYCTDNVIVMEYIPYKTINNITDNEKVTNALNSYVRQSFYALFHNIPVVYHGDMHPGNLFVDKDGNLGFLDMGLVFEISQEDMNTTRELFLGEWLKDTDKLSRMLRPWFKGTDTQFKLFEDKLIDVVNKLPNKCVSSYFMDIVFLCLDVDLVPPYFLFCMAKAFVCLFGADSIYLNKLTCKDMLDDLVLEYMADNLINESKGIIDDLQGVIKSFIHKDKSYMYRVSAKYLNRLNNLAHYFSSIYDKD